MALEVASKPESKWPKFCQSASNATSIGVFKMLLASVLSSCTSMESVATETLLFEEPTLGGRDTGRQESVAVDVSEPPYKKSKGKLFGEPACSTSTGAAAAGGTSTSRKVAGRWDSGHGFRGNPGYESCGMSLTWSACSTGRI